METFTQAELAEALRKVQLWVKQDRLAYRGTILHHEDAANDIILSIKLSRTAEEHLGG